MSVASGKAPAADPGLEDSTEIETRDGFQTDPPFLMARGATRKICLARETLASIQVVGNVMREEGYKVMKPSTIYSLLALSPASGVWVQRRAKTEKEKEQRK